MLDEALRVVEAARALGLERTGKVTRSSLDPRALAGAISALLEEIERFDRATGTGVSDPGNRPTFAFPPPVDQPSIRERILLRDREPDLVPDEAEIDQALEERHPHEPVSERRLEPRVVPASATRRSDADLGDDGAFFDGDESAADLMLAIHSINDKLGYAVTKVGWSPRLRALAEAARIANNNMYIEVDGPNGWVRIPAEKFGPLSVAIAEAALDQDLTIALPKPRPSRDREMELDYLPKPRPRW